uniref:Uncharacterized protein n=1 Tax=Octactis speculum TaxID=3111310 RepID=A0A7S2DT09_9STRA
MPLEMSAFIMNSSQVSGAGQLQQTLRIIFPNNDYFAPYRKVGRASVVAWFFQYSVMGFVFQVCDRSFSRALGIEPVVYGEQLMEDPKISKSAAPSISSDAKPRASMAVIIPESTWWMNAKYAGKAIVAPLLAGIIESGVANRAEAQRFFGFEKFASVQNGIRLWQNSRAPQLCRPGWGIVACAAGPGFTANASRNFIMSGTSFVATPSLYRQYFPQEQKSTASLFWFGLGMNIFFGNVLGITQQALWGRTLDMYGRPPHQASYRTVIAEGWRKEGPSAFFTLPKWSSRVLMNAPIQGTMPFFYNQVLPLGEPSVLKFVKKITSVLSRSSVTE